jgi:pilus assembly protein CpaD
MQFSSKRATTAAIALSLGLALSACNSTAGTNRSLDSVKQPVVERSTYTLDLPASFDGLSVPEQVRLADWFDTMNLRYGDRIAIDDAGASPAIREDVASIAGRYGLLVSDGAPVTEGFIAPGNARVVVTRSRAHVPGCPDWSDRHAEYSQNATSPGFGCSVNGNMAAMVADPEHLLRGAAGTGETVVMSSTKAINTFRDRPSTGAGGLAAGSSQQGGS